ncbi:MAG TPA: T9SS type A sorting domain-containing protein, partial [Bacteroidia bacterium]|nr:T9SS type A sorting domain-containing protein [Bacteroidia bacterium]
PQGFPFEIYGTITTSINTIEVEDALTILPNPSKGNFMINASFANRCNLEINIMDLQGRSIYSENVSDVSVLTKNVVLNDVSKGIYLLKITTDTGKTSIKKITIN